MDPILLQLLQLQQAQRQQQQFVAPPSNLQQFLHQQLLQQQQQQAQQFLQQQPLQQQLLPGNSQPLLAGTQQLLLAGNSQPLRPDSSPSITEVLPTEESSTTEPERSPVAQPEEGSTAVPQQSSKLLPAQSLTEAKALLESIKSHAPPPHKDTDTDFSGKPKAALAKSAKESESSQKKDECRSKTVVVSSESEMEDDDFVVPKRKFDMSSFVVREPKDRKLDLSSALEPSQSGGISKKTTVTGKRGGGRPKNSKNKGPSKSSLKTALDSLQEEGSLSIINVDDSNSSSRTLRSKATNNTAASVNQGPKHSVDIGFDFDVKKKVDAGIQESLEACITSSNTSWDDVVGLDDVKRALKEAAVLPLRRPDLFGGYRKPPRGILLYGPPGTGKTMLGKCAASQANSTFFSITSSDIMSKWLGDGEKTVAALFHLAEKKQPSIIFIDEVDSLLTTRREGEHDSIRRIKTEFLAQWEGISKLAGRVLVIGATNRPMDLDAAALRRFSNHLYVPLPEREARKKMFEKFAKDGSVKVNLSDGDLSSLGCLTSGYSAADISNVIADAAMVPLQKFSFEEALDITADELDPVSKTDIVDCINKRRPTCDQQLVDQLASWSSGFN